METKKSKWSISLCLIAIIALVFGFGLKASKTPVYAEENDHITFAVTVDGEGSKAINVPYLNLDTENQLVVRYTVTENTGVDALQLALSYDNTAFTLVSVVTNNNTALGAATHGDGDYLGNIVFDNVTKGSTTYNATGDVLITAYFTVNENATKAAAYNFGFVDLNDVNEFNDNQEVVKDSYSTAWKVVQNNENSSYHSPVQIRLSEATVYIRGTYDFTLSAEGKTYNGVAAQNSEIIVTENNAHDPEYSFVWFTKDTGYQEQDVYRKLDENPTNVGAYYVVLEYAATNYYDAYSGYTLTDNDGADMYALTLEEGKVATYTITAKGIEISFAYKSEEYGKFTADTFATYMEQSGYYTVTGLIGQDSVNVSVNPSNILNAAVGEYSYGISGDNIILVSATNNPNYVLTEVSGTFVITAHKITVGDGLMVDFDGNSFNYDGTEKTISISVNSAYVDIVSATYSGGETSGNGAINVGEYTINATLSVSNQNYILVNSNNEQVTGLSAVLTIVATALTQEQVDTWVSSYATFYAVDNSVNHELTISERAGSYSKTYDANPAYIGVQIIGNDAKLSHSVEYKIGDMENYATVAAEVLSIFATYSKTSAGVYTVNVNFIPGTGYAFATGVVSEYTITLTISKAALIITPRATVQYSDAAAVVSVDDGTGWVNSENYDTYNTSADTVKTYVVSSYSQGQNAGTTYNLTWTNGAKAALEGVLVNYVVTLNPAQLTVAKKVVNASNYGFTGYTDTYDGASHNLSVTNDDALVDASFARESSVKSSVKDVADNGTYTATITLADTNNYTFDGGNNDGWTVDGNEAFKTAPVAISAKPLTISASYTETTATFSLSGFAAQETEAVLTGLAYLAGGSSANIEGNVYTIDSYVADAIVVSATSSNTNYTISNTTLRNIRKVEYVAGPYEIAVSGVAPTMPATELLFNGFTATQPSPVALHHYTFVRFATDANNTAAFDFTQAIEKNKTVYAIWAVNAQYSLTLYYMVDGNTNNKTPVGEVVSYFSDDAIHYGTELPNLSEKAWFKVQEWFTDDGLTTRFVDSSTLSANTVLYANYKFNIGLGDVNANGSIDANDIILYRQWIVGGYTMTEVEEGNEWTIVNSENFNQNNTYFLKRVADSNAMTAQSTELGDNQLDIRDVSTIRMGLVGGYGFTILSGKGVDGESLLVSRTITIDNASDLFAVAKSGSTALLADDITEENFIASIVNGENDVIIDLNNHILTLKSLSISLSSTNTGKIEIKNGSIRVAEGTGVSLVAPAGSVILDNVTLYDEDGQFTLQAANQSLHFVNAVAFKRTVDNEEVTASVNVEKDTHVVVESEATVTVDTLVVTDNFEPSEAEGVEISLIVSDSNQTAPTVTGNKKFGISVSNAGELTAALANNTYDVVSLANDILPETAVEISGNATIYGEGHKLYAKISGSGIVTLNNVWTTKIEVGSFTGTLVFNGGVLDSDNPQAGDTGAAFYSSGKYATYEFRNMKISANITKGIKIANAKSVLIDGCEFDATKLSVMQGGLNSDIQSLSLVDIQITNNSQTDITITNSKFVAAPQGSEEVPEGIFGFDTMEDSDTAAAIKLKVENGYEFGSVTITGNTFSKNYRDIVVGTAPYVDKLQTNNTRGGNGLRNNKIDSWTISGNTTSLTAAVVEQRGVATLSHTSTQGYNKYTTYVGKVGEVVGGVAIWTIGNAFEKVDGTWYYVEDGVWYSVAEVNNQAVLTLHGEQYVCYTMNGNEKVYYTSLQDAVNAANGATTVYLVSDANGDGVVVRENKNITFDFNGYTYILDGTTVGSAGTETNGFQLLKGSTVTFKNGTLKTVTAYILLQNYADTTLDNFVVSGEGASHLDYVASNNFGSLTVKSGSKILAFDDQVAFDLWYGMSAQYEAGITVTLKAGSEVVGKVEYGAHSRITGAFTEKAVLNVEDGAIWDEVIYLTSNINLASIWCFDYDCTINLNGRTISTQGSLAISAFYVFGAELTIEGNGNVNAQETCVTAWDGATVVIKGGTFTSRDNFVVGTNGTSGRGGNTIIINGGTFNGYIQTSGYIACGIYVANNDTVIVNGGTFNINNGIGILARSGKTTVNEDVIFNVTGGETAGWVGDKKLNIPTGHDIVLDLAPTTYPGGKPTITNNSLSEVYTIPAE